ncbi:MAG: DUF4920 domain-containing protein [Bacteroidia bacterium]|nr:DUF4920 domain-containing protein [Bacteroidia bacterium]
MIRKTLVNVLLVGIVVAIASCGGTTKGGTYGESFTPANPISIDEVLQQMNGKESMEVEVKGSISAVCKHSGCWITFTTKDGEQIYINTINESFSLPQDVVGKTAIAKGKALSVEKQKEIEIANGEDAEDLDWIDNISIEATGIIVE